MNNTQIACLQKLVNALQECESVGVSFSHSYLRLDVEDDESHYLENISSQKLSELLNFIDGCGVFSSKKGSLVEVGPDDFSDITDKSFYMAQDTSIGYDNGSDVGDLSAYIEIKDGVVTKWQVGE